MNRSSHPLKILADSRRQSRLVLSLSQQQQQAVNKCDHHRATSVILSSTLFFHLHIVSEHWQVEQQEFHPA
jgi:hypothetical protein